MCIRDRSTKINDNEFMALEAIKFDAPKTKEMVKVLANLEAPVKTCLLYTSRCV